MDDLLLLILFIVYIISTLLVCYNYATKEIKCNIISVIFLFCPVINTLYVIILIALGRYAGLNGLSNTFKELFKQSNMPSIRKTKKRLKMGIAEDWVMMKQLNRLYPTMSRIHLWDAINQSLKLKEQELQQLKRKKR